MKSDRPVLAKPIPVKTFDGNRGLDGDFITVWVHGTNTNPLIRKFHTSGPGITSLVNLPEDWGLRRIGEALAHHDPAAFPKDDFFAFGWSGKLSFKERQIAAVHLVSELRGLLNTYKVAGRRNLKLRLIGHSHGGNVILNASEHLLSGDDPIRVEEAVLLACPVQPATQTKIDSEAFNRVYALYSRTDMIQVMDPHGLKDVKSLPRGQIFSSRRFQDHDKLVQAEIKWRGRDLTHAGFIRKRFAGALPSILAELRQHPYDCVLSIIP